MRVNTNLPEFQNEQRTISNEITKLDLWKFLIYLYGNHFQSFLTVLRDLTGISIPSLMNNKRAYFNFRMKLPRVQAMNINSNILCVLSAKLLKFAKYFHCGTEIWDKIINSKQCIENQCLLSALNTKLHKIRSYLNRGSKPAQLQNFRSTFEFQITLLISIYSTISETFVNIVHISVLGPNLPEPRILGQDNQFQVLYS